MRTADTHPIAEALADAPVTQRLMHSLPEPGDVVEVRGAHGAASAALAGRLARDARYRTIVLVAPDSERAEEARGDLDTLYPDEEIHLYPQSESLLLDEAEQDVRVNSLRLEAVEALLGGRSRLLVTTLRALQERVPLPESVAELKLELRQGEEAGFQEVVEALQDRGFRRADLVEEVGQYSVRGGVIDVFAPGLSDPVRMEFWGDEIASLRAFEVSDQRSRNPLESVELLPFHVTSDVGGTEGAFTARSLLELLPDSVLVAYLPDPGAATEDPMDRTWRQVGRMAEERRERGRHAPDPGQVLLQPEDARERLHRLGRIQLLHPDAPDGNGSAAPLDLGTTPPPPIERDLDRLAAYLREGAARGDQTLLLCDNTGQLRRLEEILEERGGIPPGTSTVVGSLSGGFVLRSGTSSLRVLTDHEIFQRERRLRARRSFRGSVALENLSQLSPGDYVVHMDHGIGRFRGLEHVEVGGEAMEALALEYAGGEVLRVPVHRLDQVERWVGETEDAEPPQVHRVGGKQWKTLKRKTEEAIEKMATDLLRIYAERELAEGFRYSVDSRWQEEMEDSFLYDDTPDQRRATKEVKEDMQSQRPMDRLLCGDVGYGKTEVAIRAAFKAVQDGKQVAVLAPTTVLVEQHRRTLQERLADFPVRIDALSRFRTARDQQGILESLAEGSLDIVVGTHRLLSEDVTFKDLGLMIVDEEQRFGVKHKERLKELRSTVDVLTLTATPIPRTLQLSLAGLRNVSLMQTPPRDRLPVVTQAIPWSDPLVAEAIARELDRGGQVFFLHNRVETLATMAERIRDLAPEASVDTAHGQMGSRDLDRAMRAFVDGETDVLVCSAIIENGLDVPNANTLIVNRADHFGLSQLYQIRGRVGRSDRQAYCYLVVPDEMTDDAKQRIQVLQHYTELGSGYAVALRDLELRGAGNLLGADQSGFAHAVGLDTYLRLLEDTVRRLRDQGAGRTWPEPDVALDGSAYLPDGYIGDAGQKLHLYRRLSRLNRLEDVDALREEVDDRFGPPPSEVRSLFEAHAIRILGRELGIERLSIRKGRARVAFHPDATPRLAALEVPFRDRQVQVEVKRMTPLSLELRHMGTEPLLDTLIRALRALAEDHREAA